MANIKSAKKRVKVNAKKAANNKARNSALKTAIKKANVAIETNADDKDALVKDAIKKIDQAASKGILHKNKAGLIASFTTILSKENVNVDDMTNKSRGDYAYTLLDLGSKLTDAVVEEIKNVDGVIKVRVVK